MHGMAQVRRPFSSAPMLRRGASGAVLRGLPASLACQQAGARRRAPVPSKPLALLSAGVELARSCCVLRKAGEVAPAPGFFLQVAFLYLFGRLSSCISAMQGVRATSRQAPPQLLRDM